MKSPLGRYSRVILFVFLSASLCFVSCTKDETTTGPDSGSGGTGSAYLTFKVNGVAMNFSNYSLVGYYYATNNGTYITNQPNGFSYPELDLGFPGKTIGTFTQTTNGWVDYTDAADYNYYGAQTCTITVTQYGDVGGYIVGTFSSNHSYGGKTAAITEGKFSIKRTY